MSAAAVPAAATARASRPGYDASADATARRVLPMLAEERVIWLSTVHPDGAPHLVPTWFWWDGIALMAWSKPDAVKVRNLRANPRLMVAVGDPGADFAVGLVEAMAELVEAPVPDAFLAKYAGELGEGRLDPDAYRALYTQAIRIVPTRFLAWRGRGARHEAASRVAAMGHDPAAVSTGPADPVTPPGATVAATQGRRPCRAAWLADWIAARLDRASLRLRDAAHRPLPMTAG